MPVTCSSVSYNEFGIDGHLEVQPSRWSLICATDSGKFSLSARGNILITLSWPGIAPTKDGIRYCHDPRLRRRYTTDVGTSWICYRSSVRREGMTRKMLVQNVALFIISRLAAWSIQVWWVDRSSCSRRTTAQASHYSFLQIFLSYSHAPLPPWHHHQLVFISTNPAGHKLETVLLVARILLKTKSK